jgi:hypothetical protein
MPCPDGKESCPSEYSKEGLCDWPYLAGMDVGEIRYTTQVLQVV